MKQEALNILPGFFGGGHVNVVEHATVSEKGGRSNLTPPDISV